ncbi:MAG TPA: hypothetical protein VLE99_06725 [Candidatus Saccharimonadales bacterium]|nr:hypothetical protein [Candidatus Saccharimonadales bacterium]
MAELPHQYHYAGNPPAEHRSAFEAHLHSEAYRVGIQNEVGETLALTDEEEQQFNDVFAATLAYYAAHHDVDITPRMPSLENVHLLSDEGFMWLARRMGVEHDGLDVYGFLLGERDVVLRDAGDPTMNAYVLQHEIIHLISRHVVRLQGTARGVHYAVLRAGFVGGAPKGDSTAMEEYTAEETARGVIRECWPKFASLRNLRPEFDAHEGALELGGVVADRTGIGRDRLLHDMQTAHITGSLWPLVREIEAIERTWGPGVNREIALTVSSKAGALAMRLA